MLEIRTEIEIASEPEPLWAILTNFAAYPQWNPFIRTIQGEAKTGG
ncbi:MAG: SRPBCC family protein [Methylovulum sp.]|nr:SRPBCC family protein [Methylovulum sp.]